MCVSVCQASSSPLSLHYNTIVLVVSMIEVIIIRTLLVFARG